MWNQRSPSAQEELEISPLPTWKVWYSKENKLMYFFMVVENLIFLIPRIVYFLCNGRRGLLCV